MRDARGDGRRVRQVEIARENREVAQGEGFDVGIADARGVERREGVARVFELSAIPAPRRLDHAEKFLNARDHVSERHSRLVERRRKEQRGRGAFESAKTAQAGVVEPSLPEREERGVKFDFGFDRIIRRRNSEHERIYERRLRAFVISEARVCSSAQQRKLRTVARTERTLIPQGRERFFRIPEPKMRARAQHRRRDGFDSAERRKTCTKPGLAKRDETFVERTGARPELRDGSEHWDLERCRLRLYAEARSKSLCANPFVNLPSRGGARGRGQDREEVAEGVHDRRKIDVYQRDMKHVGASKALRHERPEQCEGQDHPPEAPWVDHNFWAACIRERISAVTLPSIV